MKCPRCGRDTWNGSECSWCGETRPSLYDSMAAHPDIQPVLELLKLVDPVDEFSRALVLVRDCFATNNTLRALSRKALRRLLSERTALLAAYETAVMKAAQDRGHRPKSFMAALTALPRDVAEELRRNFTEQAEALMGRPLG